jgi:hypothetical protein
MKLSICVVGDELFTSLQWTREKARQMLKKEYEPPADFDLT